MSLQRSISACVLSMLVCASFAQSTTNKVWDGVWQGDLAGQPSVTLTLAEESGQLGGTVVFNAISQENGTARVLEKAVHLVHPQIQGNTLSFRVVRKSDSKELAMAVLLLDSHRARLQCTNCGEDANS